MTQPKTSIGKDFQDNTLARLADRGLITTIYLRNRMSLRGRVVDFDPYVVVLEPLDGSPVQMVYKSAIVSIAGPPRPRRPGPPRPGGPRPYPSREEAPAPRPSEDAPAGGPEAESTPPTAP